MALLLEVAGLSQNHIMDGLSMSSVSVLTVDNLNNNSHLGTMTLAEACRLTVSELAQDNNISSVIFSTTSGKITVVFDMTIPTCAFGMMVPGTVFNMR